MKRPLLSACLVVAAALFAASILTSNQDHQAGPIAPKDSRASPSDQGPEPATGSLAADLAEPLPSTTARIPAPAEPTGQAPLSIGGSLALHSAEGTLQAAADGHLDLLLMLEESAFVMRVPIHNGAWQATLRPRAPLNNQDEGHFTFGQSIFPAQIHGARIQFAGLQLAAPHAAGVVREPPDFQFGVLDTPIKAWLPSPIHMRVEGIKSGDPLANVTVLPMLGTGGPSISHPGASRRLALIEAASSPFDLYPPLKSAPKPKLTCLVGSPGFAWQQVTLDFGSSNPNLVRLARAGSLQITLDRDPTEWETWLQLSHVGQPLPFFNQAIKGPGPILIEDLPVGRLSASIVAGEPWLNAFVLGSQAIDIKSDVPSEVLIVLDGQLDPTYAPLAGQVELPAAWDLRTYRLDLSYHGTPSKPGQKHLVLDGPSTPDFKVLSGSLPFDFGQLQTGIYSLRIDPLQYTIEFALGAWGQPDLSFTIPEPVAASVQLLDTETGLPAKIDDLYWSRAHGQDLSGRDVHRVKKTSSAPAFNLLVPQGKIELEYGGHAYRLTKSPLVPSEQAVHVFYATPAIRVNVRLFDGETLLAWPASPQASLDPLAGNQGKLELTEVRPQGLVLSASKHGRYRLHLPNVPGYAPIAPLDIDFVPERIPNVDIHLTRSP